MKAYCLRSLKTVLVVSSQGGRNGGTLPVQQVNGWRLSIFCTILWSQKHSWNFFTRCEGRILDTLFGVLLRLFLITSYLIEDQILKIQGTPPRRLGFPSSFPSSNNTVTIPEHSSLSSTTTETSIVHRGTGALADVFGLVGQIGVEAARGIWDTHGPLPRKSKRGSYSESLGGGVKGLFLQLLLHLDA